MGPSPRSPEVRCSVNTRSRPSTGRIEVAPGVYFAAWTYNGTVPGPTIRCTEGDHLKVNFTNAGSHPHTIHFHGIHAAGMDGVFEVVEPGATFVTSSMPPPWGSTSTTATPSL